MTGQQLMPNDADDGGGNDDDDARLLLGFFTILWSASWYMCYRVSNGDRHAWGTSPFISNAHSVPLCLLAGLSLLGVVPERVPLALSVSFFVVDVVDCIVRWDGPFLVHAVISLWLNVGTYARPVHRTLRSLSKGYLTEASTPFLNRWKRTKGYGDYMSFFLSFTAFRMVWVPWFVWDTYRSLQYEFDVMIVASVLFYLLQLAWYVRMIPILINYKVPDELGNEARDAEEVPSKQRRAEGKGEKQS